MSSREELQDYFQTSYKHGQIAKFSVIDKTQSQRPARSAFVEDLDEQPDDGLPTMGPTMFVEVDDGGWQHLPRVREMFSVHEEDGRNASGEGHAFVEVVDSDAEGLRKGSDPASGEHTPKNGINTRQSRYKGKQRVSAHSEATKSTSATSVVENDFPTKPPVHVYDVSDIGRSPRSSVQDRVEQSSLGGPGTENFMGSFGTVYPVNPPRDAFMHVPRAGETYSTSENEPFRGSSSVGADSLQPGQIPSLDLEEPPLGPNGTGGSRTPTLGQTPEPQPSFVRDVADFVDNMTIAFVAHPELSEGIRNIVRNAVGGRYWNAERDRVTAVAENVKAAAEDTSARISQVAGDMANNAERDAVRMISEALGGVFRVIGELSGAEVGNQSANGPAPPVTRPLPPHPPPPPPPMFRPPWPPMHRHHHPFSFPFGPGHRHGLHDAWNDRRRGRGSPHRPYPAPGQELSYRLPEPGTRGMDPSHLPWSDPMDYAQRDSTWGPGAYAPYYYGGPAYDNVDTEATQPNIHETKAQLEAAKAIYKFEKDRFRREKEERRKQRHEIAERRAGQNRGQRPDGTSREEEIIASIPFHDSVRGGPSKGRQTESPAIPPQTSGAVPSVKSATHVPSAQAAQRTSSRDSVMSNPIHYAASPVPPVPPVPVPIDIVSPAPPAPPIPP
ncbi:uncharacterized protein FOMMEDRAFT_120987, partial [Fomitiporia mediterranea MF3/22]|uniref:uncharacterized protein n=1 Tax=Fomitiporia mediterranea (strain MF3/22) TaxID=694068 RepID=UPI0004408478